MKNIIYIILLIIAQSKIIEIEFGKEIVFDKNNNEFEFTFKEDGILFVYISYNNYYCFLNLIISFKGYEKQIQVTSPGIGTVIPFVKNYNNKIKLEYTHCPGEGIIWFNPSSNEIKVNLNQTYEWKYDYYESYSKYYSILSSDKNKITYSVENAEKDAILKFEFNENFEARKFSTVGKAVSPLTVCYGKLCENNIKTYEIKKGESYKIYINVKCIKDKKGI